MPHRKNRVIISRMITSLLFLLAGLVTGLILAYFFGFYRQKAAKDIALEMLQASDTRMKESFGSLSLDALSKFLELAKEKLDGQTAANAGELDKKKELIEKDVSQVSRKLEEVTRLISALEKDREQKFGELTNQLKTTNEKTTDLIKTTRVLNEALSNNKVRGQWGERIAEDILQIAGFIENINYLKQKTIESSGSRPDFTFLLPKNMKLNMDVKFPASSYCKYLEAQTDIEREGYLSQFYKDIKGRIKEVTTRDYISQDQNTLDYVLLFIPNETIYSFIHEKNQSLLEEGLKNKVVFCSPITLFAVLAVIRQSIDNFSLEKTSNEILSLLGEFKKQWSEYVKKMDSLGDKLDKAKEEFTAIKTTRQNKLEKPLNKIDAIRIQKGLPTADISTDEPLEITAEDLFK